MLSLTRVGQRAHTGRFSFAGAAIVALALLSGCRTAAMASPKEDGSSNPTTGQPPAEQVWITAKQVEEQNIKTAVVEMRDLDNPIVTSGRVALDDVRTAHVFSPVTGRIVKVIAELGAQVNEGDPLAVIESPDIGTAESDANKAQADLIAADNDRKRKKDLFAKQAGSGADVEVAEDNYRKAVAELERARQKLSLLRSGTVDTVGQTYTITAPIKGEVLALNIHHGAEVQGQYSGGANQELFTIGDLENIWVVGDLYEMDFARVHVGAPVSVSVVAYPDQPFTGTVDWISGSLDPATRTARVRSTFANKERLLRPEMYATVQFSVDRKKTLAVPDTAVLRLGDTNVVFIRLPDGEDGTAKFKRYPVTVSERVTGDLVEVLHGLNAGDVVVTDGAILLSQKL